MGLRLLLFAVMTMLMPLTASAGTEIEAACYKD
jgi:hypothetical protein